MDRTLGATPTDAVDALVGRGAHGPALGQDVLETFETVIDLVRLNPNGEMAAALREMIAHRFEQAIGRKRADLTQEERICFEYALGGCLSVLSFCKTADCTLGYGQLTEATYSPMMAAACRHPRRKDAGINEA